MSVRIHTVPNDIADRVERWVTGSKIPWFYFNHTLGDEPRGAYEVDQCKYTIQDLPRLTHYFYPNSSSGPKDREAIRPLTEWIKQELLPNYDVVRLSGNLTTQLLGSELLLNIPHVDSDHTSLHTFLYYVNNSDGRTVFFDNKKIIAEVDPIKGTGALFPSNTVHAGQVPSINKNRYVINMLFIKRV